jgi:hypothetical protein
VLTEAEIREQIRLNEGWIARREAQPLTPTTRAEIAVRRAAILTYKSVLGEGPHPAALIFEAEVLEASELVQYAVALEEAATKKQEGN